ncbi:MAG TPA: hypothetical protein VJT81_06715 [Burkholderiales bacterium]|nr:hypothetical protein [Burkholderiales bacterium]
MDCLAAANLIAEKSNLKIIARRTSDGEVINYRVYRVMPDRLVFLCSRADQKDLLRIVEHYAKATVP